MGSVVIILQVVKRLFDLGFDLLDVPHPTLRDLHQLMFYVLYLSKYIFSICKNLNQTTMFIIDTTLKTKGIYFEKHVVFRSNIPLHNVSIDFMTFY